MNFLRLRADSHAQYEIRVYAQVILDMVKKWVPHSYEAFLKHRMSSKEISAAGIEVIKKLTKGQKITQEESGLSKREWGELMNILEA